MIIEHITPKNNYILHITDEKNQSGLFDVTPYLSSEVFAELKKMTISLKYITGSILSNGIAVLIYLPIQ